MNTEKAIKIWRFFVIFWPLLCLILAGIMVCYPGLSAEERLVGAGFAVVPLIFFAIGMCMFHRLLKERSYATICTKATVISVKSSLATAGGNRRSYFPIYEFQIGKKKYQVKYPTGYSSNCVSKGQQVDLYYNPKDPKLFYVPIVQKRDKRWAALLCVVGIVYPLAGMASQILSLL